MAKDKNDSEKFFEQYLTQNGYSFDHEPTISGKAKKMDQRVFFEGAEVFFEEKEFSESGSMPIDGAFDPYKRIHNKLEESWEQLNEYRNRSCSLVLYNGSAAPVFLKPAIVLGAMLGPSFHVADKDPTMAHRVFDAGDPEGYRAGFMIDYEKKAPRSTPFSSVVVLEQFPLGQVKFSQLYDEREKRRVNKPDSVENAIDTFDYIQTFESEGFDITETVLRVVIYENPFAAIPLPRNLFQGPYDERWGVQDPDNIVRLFTGTELQKLDAAVQSYRRSPLDKAGILKVE